mmetsp:Transcript_77742/g.208622  ORF Transcript_77742/g.208622 Transcript_77742/m.208622 type:complete len:173 (+) Transcript_77742:85-603(+)
MSLHRTMAPLAADGPICLTAKNTFLDCPSPWIDYVTVVERPKSDPTSDATTTSESDLASRESLGSSNRPVVGLSAVLLSLRAGAFGGGRLAKEEGPEQQSDSNAEKDGNDSLDDSDMCSKPQGKSRSQRRRLQRKAKEAYFGKTMDAHSVNEHAAENSSAAVRSGTSTKISL